MAEWAETRGLETRRSGPKKLRERAAPRHEKGVRCVVLLLLEKLGSVVCASSAVQKDQVG